MLIFFYNSLNRYVTILWRLERKTQSSFQEIKNKSAFCLTQLIQNSEQTTQVINI